MKQITFTLFCTLLYLIGISQVPTTFSYQAIAKDNNGECLKNETISLQVSILENSPTGNILYQERWENNITTNVNGHFQFEIGDGDVRNAGQYNSFEAIPWNNNTLFLKIEYETANSPGFKEVGTTEFLSVPYAKTANNGKLFNSSDKYEFLEINGENGNLTIFDDDSKTGEFISTSEGGKLTTYGPNGQINVELGVNRPDNPDYGAIRIANENGLATGLMGLMGAGVNNGYILLYGRDPDDNDLSLNVALTSLGGSNPDRGRICVYDENGNPKVCLDGDGLITANTIQASVKNFVMPHPNQPAKEIVYASIEGPEAGAYERGTVELINGKASVNFSETFEIVANPETMTFQVTPWSADSKGLAVIERTATGFTIKELGNGTGNYKVDWEVKAVRKGWENYQVIRDKKPNYDPSSPSNH